MGNYKASFDVIGRNDLSVKIWKGKTCILKSFNEPFISICFLRSSISTGLDDMISKFILFSESLFKVCIFHRSSLQEI